MRTHADALQIPLEYGTYKHLIPKIYQVINVCDIKL